MNQWPWSRKQLLMCSNCKVHRIFICKMNIYIKKKDIVLGNKRSVDDIMHQLYSRSTGNRENLLLKIDLPGCIFMYLYYMYTGIWMDKTMWNRTSFFNHQLDLYNQASIALLKNKKTYTKYIKNSDVKENAF